MLPGFLLKKETEISHKAAMTYHTMCLTLDQWLKDRGKGNLPMRKITEDDSSKLFKYIFLFVSELHEFCTSLGWIVGSSYPMKKVNRTPFQSFLMFGISKSSVI